MVNQVGIGVFPPQNTWKRLMASAQHQRITIQDRWTTSFQQRRLPPAVVVPSQKRARWLHIQVAYCQLSSGCWCGLNCFDSIWQCRVKVHVRRQWTYISSVTPAWCSSNCCSTKRFSKLAPRLVGSNKILCYTSQEIIRAKKPNR